MNPVIEKLNKVELLKKLLNSNQIINLVKKIIKHGSCFSGSSELYIRPLEHWRAVYKQLDNGWYLCIKGLEPSMKDFSEYYQHILNRLNRDQDFTLAEYFIYKENKMPGALSYSEAITDYNSALQAQQLAFNKYNSHLKIPLPIMVLRHAHSIQKRYIKILNNYIKPAVKEPIFRQSLAIYIYLYPSLPIRVKHRALVYPHADIYGYMERNKNVLDNTEFNFLINSWLEQFVKLLSIGIVPCDFTKYLTGSALRAQNLVLDGGIVDTDSFISISSMDNRVLFRDLYYSISELADSIILLLIGEHREEKLLHLKIIHILFDMLENQLKEHRKYFDHKLYDKIYNVFHSNSLESILNDRYPKRAKILMDGYV